MPVTLLLKMMEMRKLETTFTPTKSHMVKALVDYLSKPVVYSTWSTESLKSAIEQRGLPTYNTRAGKTRARLINILETADARPKTPFPFMNLVCQLPADHFASEPNYSQPIELRLEIYKYAVTSSNTLVAPKTPAITRMDSKTRAESLPIFFATNKFLMHGYLGIPYLGTNPLYTRHAFTVDERTTNIWEHYPETYKKHVRNLVLSIHWGFMDNTLSVIDQVSSVHTLMLDINLTDIERKPKTWTVTVADTNDYADGDSRVLSCTADTHAPGWWRAKAFCGVASKSIEEVYGAAVARMLKKVQAYHFHMVGDMARFNLKRFSAPKKDPHSAKKAVVKGFKHGVVDYFVDVLSDAQDVMLTRGSNPLFGKSFADWNEDDEEDESDDEDEDKVEHGVEDEVEHEIEHEVEAEVEHEVEDEVKDEVEDEVEDE